MFGKLSANGKSIGEVRAKNFKMNNLHELEQKTFSWN